MDGLDLHWVKEIKVSTIAWKEVYTWRKIIVTTDNDRVFTINLFGKPENLKLEVGE
jgi:hypothetical protein